MSRSLFMVLVVSLSILNFGCDQPVKPDESTVTLTPVAGVFGLTYMQGLKKTTAATQELMKAAAEDSTNTKKGPDVSFNLGSIKGSTAFYFLLYNVGGRPITNVSLHLTDSNFAVFPTNIDTVFPDRTVGMLPVIKVSAYHGTPMEGVGYRPVMPMGNNLCSLVVSGTTKTNNGNDTSVSIKVKLKINALLMDAVFRNDGKIIDLTKPDGSAGTGTALFDNLNLFNFTGYRTGKFISITNTGNVSLDMLALFSNENGVNIYDTLSLHIGTGKTITILRDEFNFNINQQIFIRLNSKNTTSDLTRFPLLNDGNYYCVFFIDPFTINFNSPLYTFVFQAKKAQCADKLNNLFLIDSNLVFWDKEGNCSDTISKCMLFNLNNANSSLCECFKTTAGQPVKKYNDSTYNALFEIIYANKNEPDLGLGSDHRVARVLFKNARNKSEYPDPNINMSISDYLDDHISYIKSATCREIRNSLFLIDSSLIFTDREGSCDTSYDYSLEKLVGGQFICREHNTDQGPVKEYFNPDFQSFFDTICTNRLEPDLGLGPAHKVDRIHYDGDPNP